MGGLVHWCDVRGGEAQEYYVPPTSKYLPFSFR